MGMVEVEPFTRGYVARPAMPFPPRKPKPFLATTSRSIFGPAISEAFALVGAPLALSFSAPQNGATK